MPTPRSGPRRDPTLPHQVVITTKSSRNIDIMVSCNCRRKGQTYESMGLVNDFADVRRLYNDPANHIGEFNDWLEPPLEAS